MSSPSSAWQPTVIRGIVSPGKSTASQVVIVETDQGNGYLKALGNSAGTHSLAVELVATRMAAWLGLPTLTPAVIQVTNVPPVTLAEDPVRLAMPGPAFITREEIGSPWGGEAEELERIDNPHDLAGVVVFDTWVRNCDRYFLLRDGMSPHKNRDNVFLSTAGASRGRTILKPIDHAQCFCFATVLTPDLLRSPEAVEDQRLYGYFPEFRGRVSEPGVRAAISRAASITEAVADGFFAGMPAEWEVADGLRIAWRELIIGRATFLLQHADRICSLL